MTCYWGGDTDDLEDGAKQILHILMTVYPGHNVKVWGYKSGVFHITHLDFEQSGSNWGMALKGQQFYSASHMQSEVIRNFGEWLERAKLKRGAATDDEPHIVDGVPIKNHAKIPKPKAELDIPALVDAGKAFLRDNPMPQVTKQMEREASSGN
jgi:hypothetical protein